MFVALALNHIPVDRLPFRAPEEATDLLGIQPAYNEAQRCRIVVEHFSHEKQLAAEDAADGRQYHRQQSTICTAER